MIVKVSFILRNRMDCRNAFIALIFLGLAFFLPSLALAEQDEYTSNPSSVDRDTHFYKEIYPLRRHWHTEEVLPSQPLTESPPLKRAQEQDDAKVLKQSLFLKEMQEKNKARALKRSLALKELQKKNRTKALERSRALNKMLKQNKAKALERALAVEEMLQRDRTIALGSRNR